MAWQGYGDYCSKKARRRVYSIGFCFFDNIAFFLEGEIPQYYVEGNHEAIIPPKKFDMVQREMAKRGKGKKYHSNGQTIKA